MAYSMTHCLTAHVKYVFIYLLYTIYNTVYSHFYSNYCIYNTSIVLYNLSLYIGPIIYCYTENKKDVY